MYKLISKTLLITFAVLLGACANFSKDNQNKDNQDKDYLYLPVTKCITKTYRYTHPVGKNESFAYLILSGKSCAYIGFYGYPINKNVEQVIKKIYNNDEYLDVDSYLSRGVITYFENENGLLEYEYIEEQEPVIKRKIKNDRYIPK